jgi:hypothetical protein
MLDQNAMVGALKWARWRWGYNFSYFDLGFHLDTQPRPIIPLKCLLLDKIDMVRHNGIRWELGGEVAASELGDAVAVHATCHERQTKLLGLKASNSFWNAAYFDPDRRTITKPIMFLSLRALRQELYTLAYLAIKTNRTLIIPNVLIGVGSNIKGSLSANECKSAEVARSPFCQEVLDRRNRLASQDQSHAALHRGEWYWPGWRIMNEDLTDLEVAEPAYYFRVEKDMRRKAPEPHIFTFDMALGEAAKGADGPTSGGRGGVQGGAVLESLLRNISAITAPRLVLDIRNLDLGSNYRGGPEDLYSWALDSVSAWGDGVGVVKKQYYVPLPSLPEDLIPPQFETQFAICKSFLYDIPGNRSCFDRCK